MKFLDNLKDFFMPSEEEYMDNPEPSSQDLDQEPPMRESAARQDAPREERKSNRTLNIQTTAQLQVVLVKPEIFTDYSDHPFAHGRPAKVFNRRGEKSTASGRYQQLYLFWPHYRKQLALPDFSPLSQDRLAIQLIRERGALDDVRAGRIERAISRCRNIWASLPGAGYGQREHSLEKLVTVWRTAGGVPA